MDTNLQGKLAELLTFGYRAGASDLILVAGSPPCVYIRGDMNLLGLPELTPKEIEDLLLPMLTEDQKKRLEKELDLDFSFGLPNIGRCRGNIHRQRETLAAAFRFIPTKVPSIEDLNLPPIVYEMAQFQQGLILVTGATGVGKSSTLAAILNYINEHFSKHVITLEDPIEFIFSHRKSLIEQREIGEDSPSFASALRHVLRQKPDVILVGEMRDAETISTAITAAETGHLVFATLHTMSAPQAVERIVDSFEGRQQQQVRIQLAHTLQAVTAQLLFKDQQGEGMVPACEVLIATPAIKRAIRDNETHLIPGMVETGSKFGMQTMEHSVNQWIAQGRVSPEEAELRLGSRNGNQLLSTEEGDQAMPQAVPAVVGAQ